MTNQQIIMAAQLNLVENGIIGAEEEIHTFAAWKSIGYTVRKGQKALIKLSIWKYSPRTVEAKTESGDMVEITKVRPFMKVAHFFSTSQVEKTA